MLALGERPLVIYPAYRRLVGGSWSAAAALAQIVYWWSAVGGRRYYKTDAELAAEVGLSAKEMETAKRHLRALPFLRITREGLPARTWYELDAEAFARALADAARPIGGDGELGRESEVTVPAKRETSFYSRGETRYPHAEETNTEMTSEITKPQSSRGVSNERPRPETVPSQQIEKNLQRNLERKERLDRLAAGDEAERRVLGLLARSEREQAALFRELTVPDLGKRRWQRWLQAQVVPELDRLGDLAAEVVLREAIAAATGAREPRPYIVGILRRAERPRGTTREAVEEELDLDAILGPLEED